jgi:hypothetical protein
LDDCITVPRSPAAKQIELDGQVTWVNAWSKLVDAVVQVLPELVVYRITPPSPTSTQLVELVQAIERMSAFDGTHWVPPSLVV